MAEFINTKDTLNQGRKKINESIDNSNKASSDSKNALNVSNQAVNIAKTSNDKSNDTQKQLDNIIIESGTSDAEVVQARGDEELLKYRLDKSDEKIAETLTQLRYDKVVTVGFNGDFASINESLIHLTKYYPIYTKKGFEVEVKILKGYIMKEQVSIKGLNLGWITITSEDEYVVINRDSLDVDIDLPSVTKSAFLGYSNATLPIIGTVFKMDDSGASKNTRVFSVRGNSKLHVLPDSGAEGNADRLLVVSHGSTVLARFSKFKNCKIGIGVRVSNSGTFQAEYSDISENEVNLAVATGIVNVDGSNLTNATYDGLRASTGPNIISAANADVSRAGRYGLHVLYSGDVGFAKGVANNCGSHGIFVEGGGSVYAKNAKVNSSGDSNIKVTGTASVNAQEVESEDAGKNGLEVIQGARASARLSSFKNAKMTGCLASHSSNVDLYAGNVTGAGQFGVLSSSLSRVCAGLVKARKGTSDSNKDIAVSKGGMIEAVGSEGGLSDNPNNLTTKGIIFK